FDTERRTEKCVKRQGEVAGRQITVVDTPGYSSFPWIIRTDPQHVRQEVVRSVSLCPRNVGKRYHVLNNKNRGDHTQFTELLKKIEDMVAGNYGLSLEPQARAVSVHQSERLVTACLQITQPLLAETGAGKSAARNTILGSEEFPSEASSSMVTQESRKRTGQVSGRQVTVVDTPDWLHTGLSEDDRRRDVGLCVNLSAPGPHAFLLVTPLGRSSGEEKRTLETVLEIFGERALGHTMVLFTHADELTSSTLEESVHTGSRELQWQLEKCGNRYYALNNKDRGVTQVTELLEKID
ncbi:GIMA5 GTPase, partial [Atractosteus spatula]|nr:GIMA5 GTPase [Atractosteus spatula]